MQVQSVSIVPVTAENRAAALALSVSPAQSGLVETVAECLQEAEEYPLWRPVLLMADGEAVGFAMYGAWTYADGTQRVWLDRLLIDARYQGRGLSKAAMPALLHRLRAEYGCETVYLSVYETNAVAIRLYRQFGFEFNGGLDLKGEKIMQASLF